MPVGVDLAVVVLKGYYTFSKALGLEPYLQMQFRAIHGSLNFWIAIRVCLKDNAETQTHIYRCH